jgi:hypothetical protein
MSKAYVAYHCRACGDTGMRVNESPNIVSPAATLVCHCGGLGVVLVLEGFRAPWYAAERWPERDVPCEPVR